MLRQGHGAVVVGAVRKRLQHYESRALGLRRDLSQPFECPAAKVAITVRPLQGHEGRLLATAQVSGPESYEQLSRFQLFESGLGTCYAATASDGRICYVQWLVGPQENDKLDAQFHGTFPLLAADEALLEGAYTFPEFRGMRVMPRAMAQIAEHGGEVGARYVNTYCAIDNEASIKGCRRAGFEPFSIRRERLRLLHSTCSFELLGSRGEGEEHSAPDRN